MMARTLGLPLLVGLLSALSCEPPGARAVREDPWVSAEPVDTRRTGRIEERRLLESSGVAASRAYPGVLWTHNDAGSGPFLFATDTTGAALGRWRVEPARSVDWEDIALGPCAAGHCLTIGDVGDNEEARPRVMLYRLPEPDPRREALPLPAESLSVRYPDRPRDVEAIFVDRDATTWLVTKGRSTGILLYRVPASAWGSGAATAELVDTLPIPHSIPNGHLVTGAAIDQDGRRVVVRTYRDLYLFELESGRLRPAPGPNRCEILGLEDQGEAVDWWDATTLVLTSEGRRGEIHLLRCGGGA